MEFEVFNEEGKSISVLDRTHLYEIRQFQDAPFDSRGHYIIMIHYSTSLWEVLKKAHSMFETKHPEHILEISKVDIHREHPFIVIKANVSEVSR